MNKSTGALIGTIVILSILLLATIIYPLTRPTEASGPYILDSVPDVRQSTDYSCGAASLQAILSYWGTDIREGVLMDMLHTSSDEGTHPQDIVRVAQELGFNVTMEQGLTTDELAASISEGVPVLIVAQAWTEDHGANFSWADDWIDGHYMVVIGIDDEYVYLEDPAILGSRGVIPIDEFNVRWHDRLEASPNAPGATVLEHLGIFIKGVSPAQAPVFVAVE